MEQKSRVVTLTKGPEPRINFVSVENETKMKRRRRRWLRMLEENDEPRDTLDKIEAGSKPK
jgi:hypothetical protein